MEFQINTEELRVKEQIVNMMVEQSIELDYMLPDYCPEIFKVLRARMQPSILSERISGNRLLIEGVADITVLYLGENSGKLNRIEQKQAFTKTVELGQDCEGAFVSIRAKCDSFHCRAQNSRRLELRGVVSLGIAVYQNRAVRAVCDCPELQLHRRPVTACDRKFYASREFTVKEELRVGDSRPAIREIVDYTAHAAFLEQKLLADKVICKGELHLHTVYLGETPEQPEILEHTIPLSQIMDCQGIDEEDLCICRFEVVKYDLDLQMEEDGSCTVFSVEVGIRVYCEAARNREIMTVDDCYSTACEVTAETGACTVESLIHAVRADTVQKYPLRLTQGAVSLIYDLSCQPGNISYQTRNGKLVVLCGLETGILAADPEDLPVWMEQVIPCEIELEDCPGEQELSFLPQVTVRTADYHMLSAEELELRVELEVAGLLYRRSTIQVITGVVPSEDRPKQRGDDAALRIYFADEGESVWEVAKRYNTSVSAILEQDKIETEAFHGGDMVLIPIMD